MYGANLVLEPQCEAHAAAMFELLDDAELWTFTDPLGLDSLEGLRERYRRLETRRSPDGASLWLNWIVETASGSLAGFVQAAVPDARQEAVIGYVIGKRFWNRGYGTEAVGVMLAYLRDRLAVGTAVAYVDERNAASLRVLNKLGFELIEDGADAANRRLELALRDSA